MNHGKPRFSLGQVVATPGALEALAASGATAGQFLSRHVCGDWGEVGAEDWQSNEDALIHGERLLSAYSLANAERLWIITEADRSVTTLLLSQEY